MTNNNNNNNNNNNRSPQGRRPLRRRTHPQPDMTNGRSVVVKIVGTIVLRFLAEWIKDLLGDVWNDIDQFL